MRRERLRAAYNSEQLAEVYPKPHEHFSNVDHRLRVAVTIQIAKALVGSVESSADLSCGDAAILCAVPSKRRYWGDYAPGWPITGPIESTIEQIPKVDLFVCCETIEHLDDPDTVLKAIAGKANALMLSTPVDAWGDPNPEHYWSWSRDAVEEMLAAAGFRSAMYTALDLRPGNPGSYCFGIWACVR